MNQTINFSNRYEHSVIVLATNDDIVNHSSWLITNEFDYNFESSYEGFILPNDSLIPRTKPALILEDWNNRPKHNDILLTQPNGDFSKLYDSTSDANCFVVTDACNQQCLMCPQVKIARQRDDELFVMARDTIYKIQNDCKWLCFTGGEPTLNWENLIKLISLCLVELPMVNIQLLTNGTIFKDSSFAEELSSIAQNRVFCGIPVYADNPIDHDVIVGAEGSFYDTIQGIHNLEAYSIPVELRNVFTRINADRVVKWGRFIYANLPFVSRVALMGIEMMGKAPVNYSAIWVDAKMYWEKLIETVHFFKQVGIDFKFYNFPLCILPVELHEFAAISISEWKRDYDEKCNLCNLRSSCGGFFKSSKNMLIKSIVPYLN